jgi:hypothetical protein
MASAVSTGVCTDVLAEPFNDFTTNSWTNTSSTIVTGRTGNAAQTAGSTAKAAYNIGAINQLDTITVGFAWRFTDANPTNQRDVVIFRSDAGATLHNKLIVNNSGGFGLIGVTRNLTTVANNNTLSSFVQNTWYYIEVQITLHDTAGAVIMRVNGSQVINAGALDTKNAGTKTVYDQITIGPTGNAAFTGQYDDLYMSVGSGCGFKGDHTIP